MPLQRRTRVKRQVVSDAVDDIIFELVDDNDDEEYSSSSSGDDGQQQEENPSAPSQLV